RMAEECVSRSSRRLSRRVRIPITRRRPGPWPGLWRDEHMVEAPSSRTTLDAVTVAALPDRWREPMSEAEARAATERIRTATRFVCLLLLEVHEGRGWLALGYGNWERYVQSEFGMSRSRSYELLDQARGIESGREASG